MPLEPCFTPLSLTLDRLPLRLDPTTPANHRKSLHSLQSLSLSLSLSCRPIPLLSVHSSPFSRRRRRPPPVLLSSLCILISAERCACPLLPSHTSLPPWSRPRLLPTGPPSPPSIEQLDIEPSLPCLAGLAQYSTIYNIHSLVSCSAWLPESDSPISPASPGTSHVVERLIAFEGNSLPTIHTTHHSHRTAVARHANGVARCPARLPHGTG